MTPQVEFQGQLYATTNDASVGSLIARSPDGTNWSVLAGIGTTFSGIFLEVLDGVLYATAGNALWESNDGLVWTPVAANGPFANADNATIVLSEADGIFYASTLNTATGSELWWSTNVTHWTRVFEDGMDDADNWLGTAPQLFGGELLIGLSQPATVSTSVYSAPPPSVSLPVLPAAAWAALGLALGAAGVARIRRR